jgi:hypothetical protein
MSHVGCCKYFYPELEFKTVKHRLDALFGPATQIRLPKITIGQWKDWTLKFPALADAHQRCPYFNDKSKCITLKVTDFGVNARCILSVSSCNSQSVYKGVCGKHNEYSTLTYKLYNIKELVCISAYTRAKGANFKQLLFWPEDNKPRGTLKRNRNCVSFKDMMPLEPLEPLEPMEPIEPPLKLRKHNNDDWSFEVNEKCDYAAKRYSGNFSQQQERDFQQSSEQPSKQPHYSSQREQRQQRQQRQQDSRQRLQSSKQQRSQRLHAFTQGFSQKSPKRQQQQQQHDYDCRQQQHDYVFRQQQHDYDCRQQQLTTPVVSSSMTTTFVSSSMTTTFVSSSMTTTSVSSKMTTTFASSSTTTTFVNCSFPPTRTLALPPFLSYWSPTTRHQHTPVSWPSSKT